MTIILYLSRVEYVIIRISHLLQGTVHIHNVMMDIIRKFKWSIQNDTLLYIQLFIFKLRRLQIEPFVHVSLSLLSIHYIC